MKMCSKIFVTFSLTTLLVAFAAELPLRTCEPIRVKMCKDIGYNATSMPNLAWHTMQADADVTMQTFNPLLQYGCSSQLHLLLCSVYVPMCTDKVALPIGPCRSLCENVHARCLPLLSEFGFSWPTDLECSRFPTENNHETMCMEGGGEADPPAAPPRALGPSPACQRLARAAGYVYLNRSGRCAQYCDAEVLWDAAERRLAEVWLGVWAALCFLGSLAALAAHLGAAPGPAERPLALLALCHALAAVGWGVRAAAGHAAVACARDAQSPARPILSQDGLANPNCAVVFLLLYYFGMAASVWWVVLAGTWRARAVARSSAGGAAGVAAGRGGSPLQIAAWGLPAAQTVAVLVLRDVDGDELTGTCFVGNQSTRSLMALVIVPQLLYLAAGCILMLLGLKAFLATPRAPAPAAAHRISTQDNNQLSIKRLGIFVLLYLIPTLCIVASWLYEYFNRDAWLAAVQPSPVPSVAPRPVIWVFLLRILMLQILGVMTSVWILSSKAPLAWKRLCRRMGPPVYKPAPVKCVPQVLPVHYYSAAAVHTSQRTHSHSKYSTHSHRKPRPHHAYPVPLPGGETML